MGSKLGNLGAVSCIPFVLCHLVPSRRASRPRFFSDLAHLAVFALSIDRFSFLGGIICACCGVVPSPLYIDLTRASHRGICLKGLRLRRSLPLPQTDTRKNPIRGKKKWAANLVIPTKATQLATRRMMCYPHVQLVCFIDVDVVNVCVVNIVAELLLGIFLSVDVIFSPSIFYSGVVGFLSLTISCM